MEDITLRLALEKYKEIYLASRNYSPRTRIEYVNDIEDLIRFLEHLGLKEVKNIGLQQLEQYLAELDHRGNVGPTRKRKVVSIRSFLWYLYHDRYIRINLANSLISPFTEDEAPRYLTKLEYKGLLETASYHARDFAIIQLLLQTGIKLSELTGLTISDIELPPVILPTIASTGLLRVFGGRSKRTRVIVLNPMACSALKKFLQERTGQSCMTLFINRFGVALGPRGVEKILKKYLSKAAIRNASVQSLRHTFAIHQIAKGRNPKIIQEILGNKTSESIGIYVSLVKEAVDQGIHNHIL